MISHLKRFFSGFLLGLSLALVGFFIFTSLENRTLGRLYIVSSGSMEPAITTGSIVYTRPQADYSVGDIVTFYPGQSKKTTVTHRIVALQGGFIKTAGDANNQAETSLTPVSKIIGKVVFTVPYVGYLAGFSQTPYGFILLVIIPATIIVYEEIRSVFGEITRHYPARRISVNPLYVFAILLPLLGSLLIYSAFSNAYFSDLVTSSGNQMVVSASPSP